jgi:hypothetical protein
MFNIFRKKTDWLVNIDNGTHIRQIKVKAYNANQAKIDVSHMVIHLDYKRITAQPINQYTINN